MGKITKVKDQFRGVARGGFRGFPKLPLESVIHYCNVSQRLSDQVPLTKDRILLSSMITTHQNTETKVLQTVMKIMVDHEYW